MRARRHQPRFDSLDTRLVLSDPGVAVAGGGLAAVAAAAPNSSPQNLTDLVDWYLPGTPPTEPYDPYQVAIPWEAIPTT